MRFTNADAVDAVVDYVARNPGCDIVQVRDEAGCDFDNADALGFVIDATRAGRIEMVKHPQRWRFYPVGGE